MEKNKNQPEESQTIAHDDMVRGNGTSLFRSLISRIPPVDTIDSFLPCIAVATPNVLENITNNAGDGRLVLQRSL